MIAANRDEKVLKEIYAPGMLAYHKVNEDKYVTKFHYHDQFEIYYCVEGQGSFIVEDKVYSLENRSMFIMNNFEIHKPISEEHRRYDRFLVFVDPQHLAAVVPKYHMEISSFLGTRKRSHKILLTKTEEQDYLHRFHRIAEMDMNLPCAEALRDMYYFELIIYVIRLFKSHAPNFSSEQPIIDSTVEKIIYYINEHYTEDITLQSIADYMHMNKNYLCTLFKEATNTTIMNYIIDKRISLAKTLLSTNKYSISEIAFRCGFNEYTHFIRTFTKRSQCSPNSFRKMMYFSQNRN